MKTGNQVVTDVYNLLKSSSLVSGLSGTIYRGGLRPRDSKLEDLVVVFTTADGEEVQEGVVTINIFIPDIYPFDNGVPIENVARCEAVEVLLQTQIEAMTASVSNYKFKVKNAVHTQRDEERNQSFVVAKLSFKYFGVATPTQTTN